MAFRFQKRIKILPCVRLNLSKSGVSWTLGPRGASVGVGKRGTYANIGLPGTGLNYREPMARPGVGSATAAGASSTSEHLTAVPGALLLFAVASGLGAFIAAGSGSVWWSNVLTAACVGTIVLRVKWIEAEREYAAERAAQREADRAQQRKARIVYLMSRHGSDTDLVARIDAGELWIGQTAEQLRDSYGEPEDIDEKVMKTRRREIWKYDQVGANRYSTKITLDDGIVVRWDKKD